MAFKSFFVCLRPSFFIFTTATFHLRFVTALHITNGCFSQLLSFANPLFLSSARHSQLPEMAELVGVLNRHFALQGVLAGAAGTIMLQQIVPSLICNNFSGVKLCTRLFPPPHPDPVFIDQYWWFKLEDIYPGLLPPNGTVERAVAPTVTVTHTVTAYPEPQSALARAIPGKQGPSRSGLQ
jgi:hypothetical protein